jgi:hypothetical protein
VLLTLSAAAVGAATFEKALQKGGVNSVSWEGEQWPFMKMKKGLENKG